MMLVLKSRPQFVITYDHGPQSRLPQDRQTSCSDRVVLEQIMSQETCISAG